MISTNIKQLFKEKLNIDVEAIGHIAEGVSTEVYQINKNKENLFLRILPDKNYAFRPVVAAHKLALEKGLLVPEIILSEDFSEVFNGRSFMIITALKGNSIDEESQYNNSVLRKAGEELATFNQIECIQFGWINRTKPLHKIILTADFPSTFKDLTYSLDKRLAEYKKRNMITDLQISQITNLASRFEDVRDTKSTLSHTDIGYPHIFKSNEKFSGIIDFDDIRGSNIYIDLAEASQALNEQDFHSFSEGYKNILKIDEESMEYEFKLTRLFWFIEKCYWVLDFNPDINKNRYYTTFLSDIADLS